MLPASGQKTPFDSRSIRTTTLRDQTPSFPNLALGSKASIDSVRHPLKLGLRHLFSAIEPDDLDGEFASRAGSREVSENIERQFGGVTQLHAILVNIRLSGFHCRRCPSRIDFAHHLASAIEDNAKSLSSGILLGKQFVKRKNLGDLLLAILELAGPQATLFCSACLSFVIPTPPPKTSSSFQWGTRDCQWYRVGYFAPRYRETGAPAARTSWMPPAQPGVPPKPSRLRQTLRSRL